MFGRSFHEIGTAISGRARDIKRDLQTTHSLAASLQGSDSVFKRLYPAKASIESQMIDVDVKYPTVDKDNFNAKDWLKKLSKAEKDIQNGTQTWQEYYHRLDEDKRWIAEYGQRTQGQIRTEEDMFKGNEQLRREALDQNEALMAQTFSGKAKAFASRSLAAAGNMFAFTAVMEGIQFAIQAVDSWVHANEIAIQKAQEAKSRIAEIRSEYESHQSAAEELGASYEKLSKGVDTSTNANLSLSDSDYKSYLDITNRLAEAFPALWAGVDDNNNALLSLGQHGRNASEELAELLKAEEELNGYRISQDVDTAFKGIAVKARETEKSEAQDQGAQDSLEVVKNVLEGKFLTQDEDKEPPVIFRISGDLANETDAAYYNALYTALENYNNSLSSDKQMRLSGLLDPGILMQTGGDGKFDFQLNLAPLSEEDKEQVFTQINLQSKIPLGFINKQIHDKDQEQRLNEHELEQEWKEQLPSLMEQTKSQFDFQSLEEGEYGQEMQDFAIGMVARLDKSVAAEMDKSGGAGRWVRDSILLPLNDLDASGREAVSDAYKKLLELNPDDLSVQNQDQIDHYAGLIAGQLGKKSEDIRLNLGFQADEDWKKKYNGAVADSSKTLGGTDEKIQKTFTDLGIDTSGEIDKWRRHTANAKNLAEAVKMYKDAMNAETPTFTEAWDNLDLTGDESLKAFQNDLLSLAEAGKLTVESFNNTESSEAFLAKLGVEPGDTKEIQEVIRKVNQLASSSEQLASLKKGISGLTENLRARQENPGTAIGSDVLAGMDESLKSQTSEWEHYQSVMGSASSSMEEVQEATNRLASAFLNNNNYLANLTESEKAYYISQLEAMGVANAEETVQQSLVDKHELNRLKTEALHIATDNVTDATIAEVNSFLQEQGASYGVANAIMAAVEAKRIFANEDLGLTTKISQLQTFISTTYGAAAAMRFAELTGGYDDRGYKKTNGMSMQEAMKTVEAEFMPLKNLKLDFSGGGSGGNTPSQTPSETPKTETPEDFNFIETAITRIKSKIDEAKNAAKEAFASFKSRQGYYTKAISDIGREIEIQNQADSAYLERARKVGLDEKYAAQVRNGSLNIETISDEGTKKRIREYKEWYEKSLACKEAVRELKKEQEALARENIELLVTKYEKLFSRLDAKNNKIKNIIDAKEAWGFSADIKNYKDMNKNILSQIGNIRSQNKELAKLKETVAKSSEEWYEYDKRMQSNNETAQNLKKTMAENAKAAAALPKAKADKKIGAYDSADEMIDAKLDRTIRPKLKNGLINQKIDNIKYRQDAYDAAVKTDKHNIRVAKNRLIKTAKPKKSQTKAEKNMRTNIRALAKAGKPITQKLLQAAYNLKDKGKLYNACLMYNAYLEARDADKAAADLYAQTSKQDKADLAMERFNNTAAGYDYSLAENEQKKTALNSKIALDEERGLKANLAYYERLLSAENGTQKKLAAKRDALQNSLNLAVSRGLIKTGSDEWYEMADAINSVTNEMNQSVLSATELKNTIRQIKWDTFDASLETIQRINSEADFFIGLMGKNKDLIGKDNSEFTEYGKATLKLYKQQYESYLAQADAYTEEYNDIMRRVSTKELSLDDEAVIQRLRELQDAQRDSKLSAEDVLSSITSLIREQYEAQLDALDKLIQKYKDLRQNEKDAYEYQKNIAEKTKNIAALQKQLHAYGGNDTEEARAKIQKLKADLETAQQNLAEAEYDKYLSDMNDMLDGLYDDFASFIDEKLNDTDAILATINDSLCGKSDSIIATLAALNGSPSPDLQALLKGDISSAEFVKRIIETDQRAQEQRQREEENRRREEERQKGRDLESNARTAQKMIPEIDIQIHGEEGSLANMQDRLAAIRAEEQKQKELREYAKKTGAFPLSSLPQKDFTEEKRRLTQNISDSKKRINSLKKKRNAYEADINAYETWKKNHKDLEFPTLQPGTVLTFVPLAPSQYVLPDGSETASAQVQAQTLEYAQMPPEDARALLHIEPQPAYAAYAAPAAAPDLPKGLDAGNVNVAINELSLPGVTNYEDFKAALIRDSKFERAVQAMTIDRAAGGHSMAKLRHI